MTVSSVMLGFALFLVVALYLARPLMASNQQRRPRTTVRQSLLAQKEALLAEIQSLDFDFETGKLPEAIHSSRRKRFMTEATSILQKLDRLDGIDRPAGETPKLPEIDRALSLDADIEAAIAHMRQIPVSHAPSSGEIEARPSGTVASGTVASGTVASGTVASGTVAGGNGEAQYCSHCGRAVDHGDKFCSYCGQKITTPLHT